MVGGAEQDDVSALEAELLQAAAQTLDPIDGLGRGEAVGGVIAVDPDGLVGDGAVAGE